jgi:hypothetical protein
MEVEIRTDLPAKIKVGRERAKDSDPEKVGLSQDGGTAPPFKTQEEMEILGGRSASLVALEVLRVPPNPRLIICRYQILGEERRCMVWVGRNSNFVPGMKFWLLEPSDPTARARPWPYADPLPRRRGHW